MNSTVTRHIPDDHKAQLLSDALHGMIVITVVICATITYCITPTQAGSLEVLASVWSGAIGYGAARAGLITRSRGGDR